MLEPIISYKTSNSPEIILDKENNIFKIEGRSIVENAHQFFSPVILWFEEYFKNPNKETKLILNLDYLNSSSSLFFMKVFLLFEKNNKPENNLTIIWQYDINDELLKDRGKELKASTELNFKLEEYDSEELEDFNFDI